ncbi:hypothetical protein [Porticoccus sp.]
MYIDEANRSEVRSSWLELIQPRNGLERELHDYLFMLRMESARDSADVLDAAHTHYRKMVEIADKTKKSEVPDKYARLMDDMMGAPLQKLAHLRVVK